MSPTQRTATELYRDLLRLVAHIAPGVSPKAFALRTMIRSEFVKSRSLSPEDPSDQVKIEALHGNAVRALSNYMLYEGGVHDRSKGGKLGAAMDKFHEKNVQGMQKKGSSHQGGVDGVEDSTRSS
eukprot:CAMPEP_0172299098 /NCGR_PEP_ID=MMETSP1058-20130122/1478_1 /TAXON_ID=83371 /ORGANISM="Detonula confervacea, Strain CCMP 353" /LENGTH=124 /DNA_ID=CAMNT_0013008427 /DNA_START=23 /DNA_END=397 /DNA_ORIENTATION=+